MQSFTGDYFYATNGEVLYNSTEVPMKDSADKDVPLIAVTGGPCSGKSTGKVAVVERFNDFGYSVLTPPEVATELFTNGAAIGGLGLSPGDFQEQVLLMQLERENRYLEIAKRLKNPKCIVLTDRGCLDGDAYMPPGEFAKLIRGMGLGRYELLSRYKSAHHLVTAADGAPGFYTTENNSARKETPEEAICLDRRTRDAWVGVSHLQVIDNSTGFEEKIARLIKGICSVLGIPVPLEIERKFIVRMPVFPPDVVMCSTDIEQAYLRSESGSSRRIRRRGQDGYFVYYETRKRNIRKGVRHEVERAIKQSEYKKLLREEIAPGSDVVKKMRSCFLWKGQYFEFDILTEPIYSRLVRLLQEDGTRFQGQVAVLEIELTEENDHVELPPFIEVIKEVTDDSRYTMNKLSRKS